MASRSQADPGRRLPPPPWARPGADGRRRRRTDREPLDRARIVTAGLALVDAEGVDALTLRRLAADLGVGTMSIYWHVRDKEELLDLIGEAVLAEIEVPTTGGDWREELRAIHRAMLGAVLRHPNAVELTIGRARYGSAGILLFERLLGTLAAAGLDPVAAFDAYQSLYLFLLGYLATARRTPAFREVHRQGQEYLRSLDPADFPAISRVAPVIGRRSAADAFEVGLEVVIAGIETRLAGRPR